MSSISAALAEARYIAISGALIFGTRRKFANVFKVIFLAGLILGLFTAPGEAQNCTAFLAGTGSFNTIQDAINAASTNGATIHVSGVCDGTVTVTENKHRLVVDGSGAGAGTRATINNADATVTTLALNGTAITVRNLVVNGGLTAILVNRAASAEITNNVIQGAQRGINVNGSSAARIFDNTIVGNVNGGIIVQEASVARIGINNINSDTIARPNTIQNNGGNGIHVTRTASATIVGNDISHNASNGILIDHVSHAHVSSNILDGNGESGIFVTENSGVNLGNATGDTIRDLPNRTDEKNGARGIDCDVGAYAAGRLGSLTGKQRSRFDQSCINRLTS